jgi:spore germination protein KC
VGYLAIGHPDAKAVLEVKPKSERMPSNSLFLSFGQSGTESPYTFTAHLFDFRRSLLNDGIDSILPVVKADKDLLRIDHVAVFEKDKLKMMLTPEDTKIIHTFRTRVRKADIKLDGQGHSFIISANEISTDYSIVTPKGERPYIQMEMNIRGIFEDGSH